MASISRYGPVRFFFFSALLLYRALYRLVHSRASTVADPWIMLKLFISCNLRRMPVTNHCQDSMPRSTASEIASVDKQAGGASRQSVTKSPGVGFYPSAKCPSTKILVTADVLHGWLCCKVRWILVSNIYRLRKLWQYHAACAGHDSGVRHAQWGTCRVHSEVHF